MVLNNVIISDYVVNEMNYPIIRSIDYYNASITINNATFINISSSGNYPLFQTMSSLYVTNSLFINITILDTLFFCDHDISADEATRNIIFDSCRFDQISTDSMIQLTPSDNDVQLISLFIGLNIRFLFCYVELYTV